LWTLICRLFKICLLGLLFTSVVRADDFVEQVTFNAPQPPGSVQIRYGGLRGLFVDELESQLTNFWIDRIQLNISYSPIWDQAEPYENLANFLTDTKRGGRWWERAWYYSRLPEKGGAPHPRVYNLDHVAVDLWLFEINSKFGIKAKEFSFSLHSDGRFLTPRQNYWKIRVRPSLSLGMPTGIRRGGLAIVFEWYLGRIKTLDFQLFVRYRDKNIQGGAELSLLRW
jgi:hypothetical protein